MKKLLDIFKTQYYIVRRRVSQYNEYDDVVVRYHYCIAKKSITTLFQRHYLVNEKFVFVSFATMSGAMNYLKFFRRYQKPTVTEEVVWSE